jgi:hypothetical protein
MVAPRGHFRAPMRTSGRDCGASVASAPSLGVVPFAAFSAYR